MSKEKIDNLHERASEIGNNVWRLNQLLHEEKAKELTTISSDLRGEIEVLIDNALSKIPEIKEFLSGIKNIFDTSKENLSPEQCIQEITAQLYKKLQTVCKHCESYNENLLLKELDVKL